MLARSRSVPSSREFMRWRPHSPPSYQFPTAAAKAGQSPDILDRRTPRVAAIVHYRGHEVFYVRFVLITCRCWIGVDGVGAA